MCYWLWSVIFKKPQICRSNSKGSAISLKRRRYYSSIHTKIQNNNFTIKMRLGAVSFFRRSFGAVWAHFCKKFSGTGILVECRFSMGFMPRGPISLLSDPGCFLTVVPVAFGFGNAIWTNSCWDQWWVMMTIWKTSMSFLPGKKSWGPLQFFRLTVIYPGALTGVSGDHQWRSTGFKYRFPYQNRYIQGTSLPSKLQMRLISEAGEADRPTALLPNRLKHQCRGRMHGSAFSHYFWLCSTIKCYL